jgi:hypothetical protein
MPSSKQRLEVWRGVRLKTSGGLTKADLIKNKRGKIVSKKKSGQAHSQNNLQQYLRQKGKAVPKGEMLHKKGAKLPEKKAAAPKPKPKPAAPKPKPKPAAPKPKPKPAPPKPKPKLIKSGGKKKKKNPKINPVTKQPYAKKSGYGGYVEKGAFHIDNIKRGKRGTKPKAVKKSKADILSSYTLDY